jgi:hypothetical protein
MGSPPKADGGFSFLAHLKWENAIMKENVENLYSIEKAQKEADLMQEKIEKGEANNYSEAEEIIEKEKADAPFSMSIKCSETKDFYYLSKKFGLKSIIDSAEDIASLTDITLNEKILLYQIAGQIKELRKKKIDLENIDLAFRYVGEKPDLKINDVIKQAELSGGKSPFDKDVGTWMSDYNTVGKSLEFLQMNNDAVIFIYDKAKLTPVGSNETKDVYANTWKMKPNNNLELKDALVGMLIIENKKD